MSKYNWTAGVVGVLLGLATGSAATYFWLKPRLTTSSGQVGEARRAAPPASAPGDPPPTVKPITLQDDQSGTVFYFEGDGQHVTAIGKDGQVLWHKNPAEEAGLRGFAKDDKLFRPVIIYAGPIPEWSRRKMNARNETREYIAVLFSTKAFGLLDKQTGEFTYLGSD